MDKTTIALYASMTKWRNQCAPHLNNITRNVKTCALCQVFYTWGCKGCPLDQAHNCCKHIGSSYSAVYEAMEDLEDAIDIAVYNDCINEFKKSEEYEEYNDRLWKAMEGMFDALAELCPEMPDN